MHLSHILLPCFAAASLLCAMSALAVGNIDVPAPNAEELRVLGTGTLDYACESGTWAALGTSVNLYFPEYESVQIGSATKKPTPDADGGSHVVTIGSGTVTLRSLAQRQSPNPNSIPEVLFVATSFEPCTMDPGTYYVQRVNTLGGAIPSSSCTDGQVEKVPVRMEFVFYTPTADSASD